MKPLDSFSNDLIASIPFLQNYARALVKDTVLAQDVVQDTLLRALSHRAQFQPGTNLRGWLTVILRNRFFNIVRHNQCGVEIRADVDSFIGSVSGGQDEVLEWGEFLRAYERLSPNQRKALALVGAQGMSYEEVAQTSGCMVGTIKSRVSRARHQLSVELHRGSNGTFSRQIQ